MSTAVLALVFATSALAQPYDLHFKSKLGAEMKLFMRAELDDLQVSGTSMGVAGSVQATILIKALAPEAGAKTTRLQVDIKDLKIVLNGAEQSPPPTPTTFIEVDDRGKVVSLQSTGSVGGTDFMATAGMPANLLAIALLTSRFPDKPVAIGDDWRLEDTYPTPFGVTAQGVFTGKLASVADGKAVFANKVEATLPDFQAANPMQPGTQMTIKECKLTADLPHQVVSLDTGTVVEAGGKLGISLKADMAGMALPADISIFFATGPDAATAQKLLAQAKKPQPVVTTRTTAAGSKAALCPVSSTDFQEKVLKSPIPVFVYFYASWSGACKRESPIVQSLAKRYAGKVFFAGVDVDDCTDLAKTYGVETYPVLEIFKGGTPGYRKVGFTSEADLSAAIDKALGG